ncbi:hypothetical protein SERLA73DRAFT_156606 [Serpula lacrymans var. lacrymans S7.3]|uniref:Uncharacterized protein n=2 Tax=Serpula lacrymans var. lacrymans TaxID=341189 RepID=F8QF63_SERL3|nr:uncharacterized protein SERLADRAFT_406808 [Serpula lacrymans var. lacrymans S7.9]EGN93022.1 hypothetical protein SERLA73DRAFT_156606 [Serpula lacrymans var. lacrymans S7.3]EGO27862.1 hypothetical protein SERLADRAFT_406808 [Serpula lacrymans var. lacrymans S7.9]
MVSTRSAGKISYKRKRVDDGSSSEVDSVNGEPQNSDSEDETSQTDLQGHLSAVQTCVTQLVTQVKSLQERNRKLKGDLERLHHREESIQSKQGKRGGKSNTDLKNQVDSLRVIIQGLKRLQQKEVKKEANELTGGEMADSDDDVVYQMRKLSRRFQDLMLAAVLEEHEECRICLEEMKLEKCSRCSMSDLSSAMADCELVHLTPNDRWDELLDVAKRAGELDHLGGVSSSEEENEEDFVDDHRYKLDILRPHE